MLEYLGTSTKVARVSTDAVALPRTSPWHQCYDGGVDDIQPRAGDMSGETERRSKMRFPITLGVRFVAPRWPFVGAGQTVNLSSKGALIASEQRVSVGERIELSVDWPAKLNGTTPLQFFAIARVLRSDAGAFALSLAQHEFRTMKKQPQSESDYEGYKAKLR